MSKKKKIILIFVGLFLLFAGLVGYSVYKDIRMENQLKKEIFAIDDLVKNTESFNTTEFNKRINRTVTRGDYAKVEKAVKNYLKDSVANLREITETLKDDRIVNLLTVENYSNDGPELIVRRLILQSVEISLIMNLILIMDFLLRKRL